VPLVASGDVHMHVRARRRLQDALTAIRLKVPVAAAGLQLYGNGERYLRERARLARLYPRELLEAAVELSLGCTFSLDELRYEYPASWCRRGRPRRATCAGSPTKGRVGAGRAACLRASALPSSTSSRSSPSSATSLTSSRSRTSSPMRAAREFCARAGARRRTHACATA